MTYFNHFLDFSLLKYRVGVTRTNCLVSEKRTEFASNNFVEKPEIVT